jgi:hypothetical protein
MDCERCLGRMLPDRYVDATGEEDAGEERPWRCVNCGEVVDAVIMENRGNNQPAQVGSRTIPA